MSSTKIMLLGAAVMLLGLAIASMNFIAWAGGGLGMALVLIGLVKRTAGREIRFYP